MARKTSPTDKRISAAFYAVADGVVIDMMDIPKVFAVGRTAIADGADADTLKVTIAAFVATIRKN